MIRSIKNQVVVAAVITMTACSSMPAPVAVIDGTGDDPRSAALHNVLRVYCINGMAYSRSMDIVSDGLLFPLGFRCRLSPYVPRGAFPNPDPLPMLGRPT